MTRPNSRLHRVEFDMLSILCLIVSVDIIHAVSIKNSVIDLPTVKCQDERVTLQVRTENIFNGRVFVKGKSDDPACSKRFTENPDRGMIFSVLLGRCGMQRLRSTQPRGMNFMLAIVVSFHHLFITKPDRAYHVRCFYMEGEELVTSRLDISMLPTTSLYDSMLMPTCEYTVRFDSPAGPIARYANVGDTVYHVWDCQGPDMGALIKSCSVKGDADAEVTVIDPNGCVVDSSLLDPLIYEPTLMRAYAKSLVFKYADRNNIYFTCQIQLCQKRLNLCHGITPPSCALVITRKAVSKRDTFDPREDLAPHNSSVNYLDFVDQSSGDSLSDGSIDDDRIPSEISAEILKDRKRLIQGDEGAITMEVASSDMLVLNLDSPLVRARGKQVYDAENQEFGKQSFGRSTPPPPAGREHFVLQNETAFCMTPGGLTVVISIFVTGFLVIFTLLAFIVINFKRIGSTSIWQKV